MLLRDRVRSHCIDIIEEAVSGEKAGAAFLIIASDKTFAQDVALEFARLVNCEQRARVSCGGCAWCRGVDSPGHPDCIVLGGEEENASIKINEVRYLIEKVTLRPFEARFKVGLIYAADRLTEEGSNSFLKILEEPPSNTFFILTTIFPDKMLGTVRSRCKEIWLDKGDAFGDLRVLDETALDIVTGRSRILDDISRDELYRMLGSILGYLRDMAVAKSATGETIAETVDIFLNASRMSELKKAGRTISFASLIRKIEYVEETMCQLRESHLNVRLAVHSLYHNGIVPLHRGGL
ncbi:MAG: hypothetical protein JW844_00845 [Candidatus Omnitrophica bacterium]|nr:hypothetical protein [Candidatus Omnitrophota bacterium]